MRNIFIVVLISFCFFSCQKKSDVNVKIRSSFKDGKLSVSCDKVSSSKACNYLIYKMNCDKSKIVEGKEKIVCTYTKITEFKLKEKESKTIPNLLKKPEICMKTDVVPTLENCVKE